MAGKCSFLSVCAFVLCALAIMSAADAGIIPSGDVYPASFGDDGHAMEGYVGRIADGSLQVTGGSEVYCYRGVVGYNAGVAGQVALYNSASRWRGAFLFLGVYGNAKFYVLGGSRVLDYFDDAMQGCGLGYYNGSNGTATISGAGSRWDVRFMYVGYEGHGNMNIWLGGAMYSEEDSYVSYRSGSSGYVSVTGSGSVWDNEKNLSIGEAGVGVLHIAGDGLVKVAGRLTIDKNNLGDSYVGLTSGGMLALRGDADDSLADFASLIGGTDEIRYWDDSLSDWSALSNAVYNKDYKLQYITDGDLAGYTVLTVSEIPEPMSICLFGAAAVLLRRRSLAVTG